jgi:ABC-type multidrug transport system fused ATPase/permease subunit
MQPNNFLDKEILFKGHFAKSVLNTLWMSYRSYLFPIVFTMIIGFFARLLLLANANLIGFWVDNFCVGEKCHPIPAFLQNYSTDDFIQALIILSGVGFLLTLIFRIWFSRLSAQAISKMYDETTFRTSRFPMSFFDRTPAGRVITRFSSDYGSIFRLFGGPLAEFFAIIFDLLAMVILIALASPYYLPLVFLIAIANYFVWRYNRNRLRQARRDLSAHRSPTIAHFAETAQGASTIRSFIRQDAFKNRFQRLDQVYLEQKLSTVKIVLGFSVQMNALTACLLLCTGALAWLLLAQGVLTIGSIGVAFGFVALSGNSVQMFFEWMTQFEEALVGVERLDHYLRSPLEKGAKLPLKATFKTDHARYSFQEVEKIQNLNKSLPVAAPVQFDNVWFRYREDLPWILKGVNFTVKAGERLGIVGRTGSGKSSLIQALFSLYPIEKGQIRVHGVGPLTVDLEHYRRHLSFISQDAILFKASLRDNLDLLKQFDDEELLAVLKKVGLEKWSSKEHLQLEIEEKGRNLSLGEKQLICMARCLLAQAPVVILDEATSSVDPQSEQVMVKASEEFFRHRTQIVIAHRLTTLEKCDRILWLENGQIRMLGKAAEILEQFQRGLEQDIAERG